ncbi:MAG: methyltransferase domain-containing protein [Polyangiaceae bacterium]|nr:methyltransferase domain-containing protein [Polyangiaceae bacterium]
MSETTSFTPAAGFHWLTPFYDLIVTMLTREERWRSALVSQIRPSSDDRIADLGCGTGSLLVRLARAAPNAHLVGIDPDPDILERARAKLARGDVSLLRGFARDAAVLLRDQRVTKIVSSLVLHQVPMAEKTAALRAAYDALPSGGELHIADYALQRSTRMRMLFRLTVQSFDGVDNTEPQARGILPELIVAAGFADVAETYVFDTLTGSISLFRAVRP